MFHQKASVETLKRNNMFYHENYRKCNISIVQLYTCIPKQRWWIITKVEILITKKNIKDIHNSWLYCFTNPLELGTRVSLSHRQPNVFNTYNQELCISLITRCFTKRLQSRPLNWRKICKLVLEWKTYIAQAMGNRNIQARDCEGLDFGSLKRKGQIIRITEVMTKF